MHADDALGVLGASAIFVIGMPDVLEARTASRRDVLLELRKDLVLQLELLGHRLEDELGAVERGGEVGLEAQRAAVACRRLEPVEHALGQLRRRPSPARAPRR